MDAYKNQNDIRVSQVSVNAPVQPVFVPRSRRLFLNCLKFGKSWRC